MNFHRALVSQKYRLLFSPKRMTKPGPKGPSADLIRAVVEMKQRNPTWGCPRIADPINLAFGTSIDKDVVRRIQKTGPNGVNLKSYQWQKHCRGPYQMPIAA